MNKQTNKQTHK